MDSQESRYLLRAMRPNGADRDDPQVREALAQTHTNPDLRAWFEREQALDRAVADKLREFHPPAELRAQILHGAAMSPARRHVRRPFALVAASLAAAASFALVIYTLWPQRPNRPTFEVLVATAVRATVTPPAPAFVSGSAAAIRGWLEESGAPVPGALPGSLGDQQPLGSSVVKWEGVRCSLVSLHAAGLAEDAPSGEGISDVVHLYTVRRNSCSDANLSRTPVITTRDDATIATWRDASNYYVLVTRAPTERLRALLGEDARVARAVTKPGFVTFAIVFCRFHCESPKDCRTSGAFV